jgi:hypothetical protein
MGILGAVPAAAGVRLLRRLLLLLACTLLSPLLCIECAAAVSRGWPAGGDLPDLQASTRCYAAAQAACGRPGQGQGAVHCPGWRNSRWSQITAACVAVCRGAWAATCSDASLMSHQCTPVAACRAYVRNSAPRCLTCDCDDGGTRVRARRARTQGAPFRQCGTKSACARLCRVWCPLLVCCLLRGAHSTSRRPFCIRRGRQQQQQRHR